jgi:hypothetical protein
MTSAETMRALVMQAVGEPAGVLRLETRPVPEPGAGQVRVRVQAAPVHATDLHILRGRYGFAPDVPAVLGIHVASTLGLFGASTALLVGGGHAATRADASDAHAVYTLLELLTVSVDIPLAVVALLSGVTLALTSKWRLFHDRWLTAKLALYLATMTVGVTLVGPSIDTMLEVTETTDPGDSGTRWMPVLLAGAQGTMLLAAATLGVFKPGGRRHRPRSATRLENAT